MFQKICMKYLLKLSYLGTAYAGFQVQPNGDTVQGRLCSAAKTLFGVDCAVTGCSRTDSGVHAKEYYATLEAVGGFLQRFRRLVPRAGIVPAAVKIPLRLRFLVFAVLRFPLRCLSRHSPAPLSVFAALSGGLCAHCQRQRLSAFGTALQSRPALALQGKSPSLAVVSPYGAPMPHLYRGHGSRARFV